MQTSKFEIKGMTCSACVSHVERSVSKLQGVKNVQVNLLTNSMSVRFDDDTTDNQIIENAVKEAGYEAHAADSKAKNVDKKINAAFEEQQAMKNRWWWSFSFLVPLLYISMGHMIHFPLPEFLHGTASSVSFAFTQFLLTFPIYFINKKYFTGGLKSLIKGAPNMDSLVAIGSGAALAYGIYAIFRIGSAIGIANWEIVNQFTHDLYFESGATILTLITLGKYLEAKSKNRTSEAITKLMDLSPKTALVLRDTIETEIPVEELAKGDLVIVKSGQRIPVDGIIIDGNANIDESALTGESMPVYKEESHTVLSASILLNGYIRLKATKVGNDTTLAQIIQLVENAAASKAPISKMADKISRVFVPIVIGIALVSTIVWILLGFPFDFALSIGIAVLVISCPCALGLATPVAIMVGTGKGAESGILIKSAESLELAHKVNTVVLDKTGTLTMGKPKVTDLIVFHNFTEEKLLSVAASLEKQSEHPLASAIIQVANQRSTATLPAENTRIIPGQGVSGIIHQKEYCIGNLRMMESVGIDCSTTIAATDKLANQGKTPLYISENNQLMGIIALADVLKPDSKEAVERLTAAGIKVVMLTGDHYKTAAYIQSQLNISEIISDVLPAEKEKEISKLQQNGDIVAMVGDGINDAPALAKANVGIAIGAGTEIAMESADIVLMRNSLIDVLNTLQLSKSVIRNIKENLFWAFFYNVVGIPLAAGLFYAVLGWKLSPMFAAAAMSLSSVSVVLNALRLRKFRALAHPSENQSTTYINHLTTHKVMTEKRITIEGMSCGHCSSRVEKALNAIEGVSAKVDLNSKTAIVQTSSEVSNELLSKTIDDAGYKAMNIS